MNRSTIAAIVCGILLAAAYPATAAVPCLGSAPAAANDAADLAAVRAQVEAACPCANFSDPTRKKHLDYALCIQKAVRAAAQAGALRGPCRQVAIDRSANTTCGFPDDRWKPCIRTTPSGLVKCGIKPAKHCKAPERVLCSSHTSCFDAADSNHDGLVGRGDSGTCNPPIPCSNPPLDNGSSCDDGNACTQTDTCQNGACSAGTPVTCTALDQCHNAGTCNTVSGVCSTPTKADGATCNDGEACTQTDMCSAGVCTGSSYSCTAPEICQEEGSCNGDGTCSFANKPDGTTCDAGVDARPPLTCTSGTCGSCAAPGTCSTTARSCAFDGQCPNGETCNPGATPAPQYVDNEDGTITDRQTCLVWEKKDAYDGTAVVCPGGASCVNPHDADNTYAWSSTGSADDGAAFTELLQGLNDSAFAGHTNWRLPLEIGIVAPFTAPQELHSIVDQSATGCGSGAPCTPAAFDTNCSATCSGVDPTCSCTAPADYWTATTDSGNTGSAWIVGFDDGETASSSKTTAMHVRSVRGGLAYQDCAAQRDEASARCTANTSSCTQYCAEHVNFPSCYEGCDYARLACVADLTAAFNACTADRGVGCDALQSSAADYCADKVDQDDCVDRCEDSNDVDCYNTCIGNYTCFASCDYTFYFDVLCYDACNGSYTCATQTQAAHAYCEQLD